jgi:hypothetical protein
MSIEAFEIDPVSNSAKLVVKRYGIHLDWTATSFRGLLVEQSGCNTGAGVAAGITKDAAAAGEVFHRPLNPGLRTNTWLSFEGTVAGCA